MKVNLLHFLSQYSGKEHVKKKPSKSNDKRAAVEQWRVKVPHGTISSQLKVSERTLRRVLTFAKAHPLNPIKARKPVSCRPRKISMPTRMQEAIDWEGE